MVPTYEELLAREDGPRGSSWGLFATEDDLGSINFLTPERVLAGVGCVRRGAIFNLDYPINAFVPTLQSGRKPAQHHITQRHAHHRDDYLDDFYLQSTSQLDGLRHRRHAEYGFYNGALDDEIQVGMPRLGIGSWAEHGIVGRGVLIDVDRHVRSQGSRIDHEAGQAIPVSQIDEAAAAQGLRFEPGDIILLRTGWAEYFLDELGGEERKAFGSKVRSAGLPQAQETLAWLWDHQCSVIATDNPAVECIPALADSPFGKGDHGLMHQELIALLGLALGELWRLGPLAADCAADRIYEFLVVSKPLNLIGGVGSPPNAIAIK